MSQTSDSKRQCLVCGQTSSVVPLLKFEYQGGEHWICPQHLPILIHKPEQLAGILPGAESLTGHDH